MSWYFFVEDYPSYLDLQEWRSQGLKIEIEQVGEAFKVSLSITATWIPDEKMPDFFKKLIKSK